MPFRGLLHLQAAEHALRVARNRDGINIAADVIAEGMTPEGSPYFDAVKNTISTIELATQRMRLVERTIWHRPIALRDQLRQNGRQLPG